MKIPRERNSHPRIGGLVVTLYKDQASKVNNEKVGNNWLFM